MIIYKDFESGAVIRGQNTRKGSIVYTYREGVLIKKVQTIRSKRVEEEYSVNELTRKIYLNDMLIKKQRYLNGQLSYSTEYADGKKHGLDIRRHTDGLNITRYNYGMLHGRALYLNSDGSCAFEGLYIKGLEEGWFIWGDSKGYTKSAKFFKHGILHGECLIPEWTENGYYKVFAQTFDMGVLKHKEQVDPETWCKQHHIDYVCRGGKQ
jgi:antitoxin component YwqK of YwqJK toxin-antitoxin module